MCCYQCCLTKPQKVQACPPSRCCNKRVPLQPALTCKQPCPCWATPEKRWYKRNKDMVDKLADLFHITADEVIPLVYKLTVREFHDLLYPKGSGWNVCHVPFVHTDVCELYAKLYDRDGNFQKQIYYASYYKLIEAVAYLLCYHGWEDGCGKCFKKKGDEYEYKPRKVKTRIRHVIEGCCWYDDEEDSDDVDRSEGFLLNTNEYGKDDKEDVNLDNESADVDDNDIDGQNERKSVIKDISDLYNKVAKVESNDELNANSSVIRGTTNKRKLKHKKVPIPTDSNNRRYLGVPIPVLYHAPFDDTKPWTWINRHPRQNRILPSGLIGKSKIERFKRETLVFDIDKARERFSVHSRYSLESTNSLPRGDMYGRSSVKRASQKQTIQ